LIYSWPLHFESSLQKTKTEILQTLGDVEKTTTEEGKAINKTRQKNRKKTTRKHKRGTLPNAIVNGKVYSLIKPVKNSHLTFAENILQTSLM